MTDISNNISDNISSDVSRSNTSPQVPETTPANVMSFNDAMELIKSGLDIIDVVQRHVILKKTGRNYTGLCPFHRDKNPSMSVSREKNLFKCFSCGEGGDALSFMMKIENKTFGEVIGDLALERGIIIQRSNQDPEITQQKRDLREKIIELNEATAKWFEEQLRSPQGQITRDYLAGRDISNETITRFNLGYAPEGWDNLSKYLQFQFQTVQEEPDLLAQSGLANNRAEGNGYYDRFRNRLIVPIHNERGQVVGFGGRALSDEDQPKYLNSPETPVYVKNKTLYGLHQAKDTIRDTKNAVVMEGYFDVIATHMAGITQAVGSCGTALTDNHLKLLTRFGAETIYLCFDSDTAGQKAALSAIELIEPYLANRPELAVKIISIPDGKDPDDYFKHHSTEDFHQLMHNAQNHLDYKFEMSLKSADLYSSQGRINAANIVVDMLLSIRHPVLRNDYLRKYAEKLSTTEEALKMQMRQKQQSQSPYRKGGYGNQGQNNQWQQKNNLQKFTKNGAISGYVRSSFKRKKPILSDNLTELRAPLLPRHLTAEKNLLRLMLLNPENCHMIVTRLEGLSFNSKVHQTILDALINNNFQDIQQLSQHFISQPDVQQTIAEYALTAEDLEQSLGLCGLSPQQYQEKLTSEADKYSRLITAHRAQQKLKTLNEQMRLSETPTTQPDPQEDVGLKSVELHYEFRDRLSQDSQSHNNSNNPSTPS